MLDSSFNSSNLRNAFKCAAPQFGLTPSRTPRVEATNVEPQSTPYQLKVKKPSSGEFKPTFMRGLDRGH
jgi:hypothetical protein